MSAEREWRIIRHESSPRPAARNMAIDESILESVSMGSSAPTLRLYSWSPSAISIGYFQGLEMEVDTSECRRRGVDVVRRITGGGAVYHDAAGELTYSVVVPTVSGILPRDIQDSYRAVCGGIIRGLGGLGVRAEFRPLNDLTVGGRKISGNAQTRRKGCILQHGTVLLDVDVDTMFSLLKVPNEKLRGKLIESVKASVTSLRETLGALPDRSKVADLIQDGIMRELCASGIPGSLTTEEEGRAEAIAGERYSNPEWTGRR